MQNMTAELLQAAQRFETPLYVYDFDAIKERLVAMRSLIHPQVKLFYAVKANSNLHLLAGLKSLVDGLDVSSGGEINQSLLAEYRGADLSFAGPGKTAGEIELALDNDCASLSIESADDLSRVIRTCQKTGKKANISLRINPQTPVKEFAVKMGGMPSPFGIDEEHVADSIDVINKNGEYLNFLGFHIYAGTQCLNIDGLTQNIANVLEVVERICHEKDLTPFRINFGGGLGIPYFSSDADFDLKEFARFVNSAVAQFDARMSQAVDYIIELGRYIVGPFGYYLSRILAVKETRGRKFVILDGGMHHNLPPSGNFGQIISKNYDIQNISKPAAASEKVDIVGCLCTTLDKLANRIEIGSPEVGDVVAIKNSGAYGLTASPVFFLGHETPREVLIKDGKPSVIRERKDLTQFN
jgi:diaminopimelate decarboxylase